MTVLYDGEVFDLRCGSAGGDEGRVAGSDLTSLGRTSVHYGHAVQVPLASGVPDRVVREAAAGYMRRWLPAAVLTARVADLQGHRHGLVMSVTRESQDKHDRALLRYPVGDGYRHLVPQDLGQREQAVLQHVDAGADHVPGIELRRQAGWIGLGFRLRPGSRRHPLAPVAGVLTTGIDGLLPGRVRAIGIALGFKQLTELEQRVGRIRVVKRRTSLVRGAKPVAVLLLLQQVPPGWRTPGRPTQGRVSR